MAGSSLSEARARKTTGGQVQRDHSLAMFLIALMSCAMPAQMANGGSAQGKEATDAGKNTLPQASRASEAGLAGDIKVHGHWTIVIRNPDGSLASRHEFENSLSGGGQALAGVLTHTLTIGPWAVILQSACRSGGSAAPCAIQETNAPALSGSEPFSNLTVQLGGTAPHQDAVILTGSAKSTQGGTISEVDTVVTTCAPTTLASACGVYGSRSQQFTSQTISPLTVQPGQTIDVTVQLSFS